MRRLLFALSFAGLVAACVVAYLSAKAEPPPPPVFTPASNPYPNGIYAQGILETAQPNGSNINVFPEVSGTVQRILVAEGQSVRKGAILLVIDDSIQRATTAQLHAQARAALVLLEELRAEPRKESLDVVDAQVVSAQTIVKSAQDSYDKERAAYTLNPKAISRNTLDSSATAVATAIANLDVARKQRDLMKAGAWSYEIRNQEQQFEGLDAAYRSASALLAKYTLRAPRDGRILAITPSVGTYVSAQGAYDTYTQGMDPVMVLGGPDDGQLQVRCFVDEILVPRLPGATQIKAQMSPRGSNVRVPLEYVRTQPMLSPKTQLSDQRQERVDVRVLPVIFRFARPKDITLYPGQLVDVFIGG